jgi:SAM-dependent methyltransferase
MALIKETQDYQRGGTQKDIYGDDDVVAVPCPLCGSDSRRAVYREHGALQVSQCLTCSLLYTSTRAKDPEHVYWGDVDRYYEEARLIFDGREEHHRDPNYLEELRLIRRFKPSGRFLDVGCNMGMLLRHVKGMGWTGVGVEPSPALSRMARERFGLDVHNCFLSDLPASEEGSFDVVALSDVFEHVTEPIEFLGHAARFLRPDGILYIKVPNARWNMFKQEALRRSGRTPSQGVWDSYEHVVHYTDQTLTKMLERAGFEVLTVAIGKPIQVPVWHEYVGHYYLYPSPLALDWKRQFGRSAFYWASRLERALRGGRVGWFAPNIVAVARARRGSASH